MKLLLDTHILLWAAQGIDMIPNRLRPLLEDTNNVLVFSAASIWEITIKRMLERPDFQVDARKLRRGLLDNDYIELPITSEHALSIVTLAPHHKDPFDRLLLAQAVTEGISLVTNDESFRLYTEHSQYIITS